MTHVQVEIDGGIGFLTIDRRERFNSLDVETARDLRKAGLQLSGDERVRFVVLRVPGAVEAESISRSATTEQQADYSRATAERN